MWYELHNPSDKVIFQAPDFEAAALAVIFLGRGQYAATPIAGDDRKPDSVTDARKVPMMFFGDAFEKFCADPVNGLGIGDSKNIQNKLDERGADVATCCESFFYGDLSDRAIYEEALRGKSEKDAAKFKAEWNDKKRTSMNNILAAAHALARGLREAIAKKAAKAAEGAPAQNG